MAGPSNKRVAPPVSAAQQHRKKDQSDPSDWTDLSDRVVSLALAAIVAESDEGKRAECLETFVAGISAAKIRSSLEALRRLPADDGSAQAISGLLRRWITLDASAASLWVKRLPPGQLRDRSLSDVAIEWANVDLASSSVWARQLPNPAEHDSALLAIAAEALRTDPTESLRLVFDLPSSPERDSLLSQAAMEWASRDAPAALAWARQITDDSLRQTLLAAITTAWSDRDPESAARVAALEIPEGRSQSDAVMGIIARWAQDQPELAAEWADQFAPGDLRQSAFDAIDTLEKSKTEEP